ncbi:hypothetical protein C7N43_09145 [Sphingobacteriales bacterium UPWRP_1]|nr:hypothetical protein B6N25_08810 [Sphingobacteriales bacterium TSM_CSS]PSJ77390.1 hypothetical protein C7N43_09145 [Sphingobacteriales bacterium UPWRP_1]
MQNTNPIDAYIARFPVMVQERLQQVRQTIQAAAPQAQEVISYQMPAYKQNGILVYFAAYANHIGFYPTASGIAAFKEQLQEYKWSKGAVQFPHNLPLPLELIRNMVQFRVKEDEEKKRKRSF